MVIIIATNIMKILTILLTAMFGLFTAALANAEDTPTVNKEIQEQHMNTYKQISQDEAMRMMKLDDGHIMLDVRRPDEYARGHIPGAILIPNETIGAIPPERLKDLDQIILVYCRSGNRSKQAAAKLAAMGYSHIYEFGGINTWTGEISQD